MEASRLACAIPTEKAAMPTDCFQRKTGAMLNGCCPKSAMGAMPNGCRQNGLGATAGLVHDAELAVPSVVRYADVE